MNKPPGRLALPEYFILKYFVVIPGVIVRFLHAQLGFAVMGAVGHSHLACIGVHFQKLRCVEEAGITVGLALLAKDECGH